MGSVASRSAVTPLDQPGFEPDHPGGANEVGFVGRALAKREFAGELHRVGADAVIGGDAAQERGAPVERRRLGLPVAQSPSLTHKSLERGNWRSAQPAVGEIVPNDGWSGASRTAGQA